MKTRMDQRSSFAAATTVGAAFLIAGAAGADTISFNVFENSDNANVGGLVLECHVTDNGTSADFRFENNSSQASSITDVYFETPANQTLSAGSIFLQSAGVSFAPGASPPNPPGSIGGWQGNHFSADSNAPVSSNGINPGEYLVIRFNYGAGKGFADLQDALVEPDFRIAMHVQSLANGSSVWAVSKSVPTPGTAAIAATGMLLMSRRRRPA